MTLLGWWQGIMLVVGILIEVPRVLQAQQGKGQAAEKGEVQQEPQQEGLTNEKAVLGQ